MNEGVLIAILSLVGTMSGSFLAQRKSTALIAYRLEQLENKVNKHNSVVERTYKLEEKCTLYDEKFKVANSRIKDLEEEKER